MNIKDYQLDPKHAEIIEVCLKDMAKENEPKKKKQMTETLSTIDADDVYFMVHCFVFKQRKIKIQTIAVISIDKFISINLAFQEQDFEKVYEETGIDLLNSNEYEHIKIKS